MGKAARIKRERAVAAATRPKGIVPTSIDQLRERIALIRDTDLRTASVDELVELLAPVYKGWTVRTPVLPAGTTIFRGRKLDRQPRTLACVSYPPPEKTRQGRANRAGSPIFYASIAQEPIYLELGLSAGDRLAIVHHRTTASGIVNRIGYTDATFKRLQSNRELPDYGNLDLAAYTERDALVDDFLSEVYCEKHDIDEDWRYNLSVAIAEKMMPNVEHSSRDSRIASMQGLIYPSIPMWANADNLALKPSYVESSLTPTYAEYVEVDEMRTTSFAATRLAEARTFGADGTINWLGSSPEWTLSGGEGVICEVVDGHWVARDRNGEIVEPDEAGSGTR